VSLRILGATVGITAVSVSTDNTTWKVANQNTGDAAWITDTRWSTSFPVRAYLRITSVTGETLYDSFLWTAVGGVGWPSAPSLFIG